MKTTGSRSRRTEGKLSRLIEEVQAHPCDGTIGIGHTRWATHGRPSEINAHPHRSGPVVVVHNGIIENYLALKHSLAEEGHRFVTETDTEMVAHLIEKSCDGSSESCRAKRRAPLSGVFALGGDFRAGSGQDRGGQTGSAGRGGAGTERIFRGLGRTRHAQLHPRHVLPAMTSDIAVLTGRGRDITDFEGRPVRRQVSHISGILSWRKKAATSTSCSRKSLSNREPFATPFSAEIGQESGRDFP
jgi:glucosamine--fructose-6-phosphate aminotransferase (isomerizing)